ncbi:hypothetical protein LTR10_015508 [Elasticomyces elasticus]|uniref:Uncharacterized protein n=1 Tax=Exophiala sideris TaxID=1016849 RepID=A0ABR0J402_9EURO|nr:hypothetical protein LTR10_015508 [Elasticomyces elasticus]KAK5026900.1 hypothetical protein LTS07_007199 [Exophiala sideris]KAK5033904.1 hypothetical protein LTR13_006504 [Exophiala sideris]KAK5055821.1 hypothetical protein LTR69_008196 [Exophiala sideris]KAK5180846.1 hypothetical protein LTR44_006666 [Eurotiomycetes sp. CCFEE 6388]
MGRQSHLARLALGRSPFDAPLQDENGDFVMGPNVQHGVARGYVQQFDSRGHPQNLESEAARRRLTRAQNDALSTVGVVVRQAKKKRTSWQSMGEKQKVQLLFEENDAGARFALGETLLHNLSTRWIATLRHRVLTYKSYVGLSVPQIIATEWSTVGPSAFFLAGLPSGMIAGVSQSMRDDVLNDEYYASLLRPAGIFHPASIARLVRTHCLRILWYAVEYPFYASAVLQSLYIVPSHAVPHPLALIPFSSRSLIQLPWPLPNDASTTLLSYAARLLTTPFVLAYVRDQMGQFLFMPIYTLVVDHVVRPVRPDRLSLQGANVHSTNDISHQQHVDTRLELRQYEPSTWAEAFRALFPALSWLWQKVLQTQGASFAIELTPKIKEDLYLRSRHYYQDLVRRDQELPSQPRREPGELRGMAIRAAFTDFNLDPDRAMGYVTEMEDDMGISGSDASTSTPEPEEALLDLLREDSRREEIVGERRIQEPRPETGQSHPLQEISTEDIQVPVNNHGDIVADGRQAESPQDAPSMVPISQPAVTLETLLDPVSSDTEDDRWARPSTPIPGHPTSEYALSIPSSPSDIPIPGLSRAASLTTTPLRPVRRATDINEDDRPWRNDVFYHPRPQRRVRHEDRGTYRVTLLSNFPADTLAHGVASVVTSTVLLPIDILFLRSLVENFLRQPPEGVPTTRTSLLFGEAWPFGFSFQTENGSRLIHTLGNWSITLAMQSLVKFLMWRASTQCVLYLGRRFGWGKI